MNPLLVKNFFCFGCPLCFWAFSILILEQFFQSTLRTMFLAQRLWAYSLNVKTMVSAHCLWAFNHVCSCILICLCSCFCVIFVPLIFLRVPCTQPNLQLWSLRGVEILFLHQCIDTLLISCDLHPLKGLCRSLAPISKLHPSR